MNSPYWPSLEAFMRWLHNGLAMTRISSSVFSMMFIISLLLAVRALFAGVNKKDQHASMLIFFEERNCFFKLIPVPPQHY